LYQAFIRRGYRRGQNFISVSNKTREDLHKFLPSLPSRLIPTIMQYYLKPMMHEEPSELVKRTLNGETEASKKK
jgi:hypothetical protein